MTPPEKINPRRGRRASSDVVHPSRIKQLGRSTPTHLSPQAKHTLTFLFAHAHDDGTDIWCSVETLMDYTGFTRRTQFRALKELIDAEYLVDDGWKDYGQGLRTRRRRLDLSRMMVTRQKEDASASHSAISGTASGDSRSAISGTPAPRHAVPDMVPRSATSGIHAVPDLAPKGTQEDTLKEPTDARACASQEAAVDTAAFDALFGCAPAPAPVARPPRPQPVRDTRQQPAPPGYKLPFNPYPDRLNLPPIPPEPKGDPVKWMPRLSDPEHRWACLAPGEEIDPKSIRGARKQCRGGWILRDICLLVAEAVGWNDYTRYTDWRPLCAWLDDGIDPHDAILPAIRRVVTRRGNLEIASLAYFDKAVREAATGPRRAAG